MSLYKPKAIYPYYGDVIDPTIANTFKYEIQGSSACLAYVFGIFDLDNVGVYEGEPVMLSTPLYNGEELSITIEASMTGCIAGNAYKHILVAFYSEEEYVMSFETLFWAYTTPSVEITMPVSSPYNLQYFDFTFTYTQAEGIGIKEYEYKLYNSSLLIIDTYKQIGTSKSNYFVDGLKSGETYYIQVSVTNQVGVTIESNLEEFSVEYNQTGFVLTPEVIFRDELTASQINWEAYQINGIPSDEECYKFIQNFIYINKIGLHINSGEYVDYNVTTPEYFTEHYTTRVDASKTGSLLDIITELHTYTLSFDGSKFIYTKDEVEVLSEQTISPYNRVFWDIVLLPTEAIFTYVASLDISPSPSLVLSSTLYPQKLLQEE